MARLDVRQESSRVAQAVAELLVPAGENYLSLDEAGKVDLLQRLLVGFTGDEASPEDLSDDT